MDTKSNIPPVSLYVSIGNLGIWSQECLYLLRNEALTQLFVFIGMDTRRIWGIVMVFLCLSISKTIIMQKLGLTLVRVGIQFFVLSKMITRIPYKYMIRKLIKKTRIITKRLQSH